MYKSVSYVLGRLPAVGQAGSYPRLKGMEGLAVAFSGRQRSEIRIAEEGSGTA